MDNKKFVELCIKDVRGFVDNHLEPNNTNLIPNYDRICCLVV